MILCRHSEELNPPVLLRSMATARQERDAKQQARRQLAALRTGDSADCPRCHNRARVVETFPTAVYLDCGCCLWREQS